MTRFRRIIDICHGRRHSLLWSLVVLGFVVAMHQPALAKGSGDAAPQVQSKLRLTWGGGKANTWRVSLRLNEGLLSQAMALGINPDTPGSIVCRDQEIRSAALQPASFGGVEFAIDAPADARISIEIYSTENPERRFMRSLQVQQLRTTPFLAPIDEAQNQIALARAPGDSIQLSSSRDHWVFDPGETCALFIKPNWCAAGLRTMRCTVRLTPARSGQHAILSQSWDVNLDEQGCGEGWDWTFAVPKDEGVYDLHFEIEPRWYQASWNQQRIGRKLQFIVLDPQRRSAMDGVWKWEVMDRHSPSLRNKMSRMLPKPPWSQATARESTSSSKASLTQINGSDYIQLPPGGWHAVPVPQKASEGPQKANISFVASSEFALSAGIWVESSATGLVAPLANEWGTAISRRDQLAAGISNDQTRNQELLFWPSGQPSWILIHNRHATETIAIGTVEILAATSTADAAAPPQQRAGTRERLAFLEWPSFIDQFGVNRPLDVETGLPIEDWQTFHEATERLIQYLRAEHYTGVIFSAYVEGGGLFPSEKLAATPRWDSGVFASSGQDLNRKDVMEMMYRQFDRAGLALVPSFSFTGPLAGLEQAYHLQNSSTGRLRDERGELARSNAGLPWYDPLTDAVQSEIAGIIEEFAARYGAHPSFRGCSLICRTDTATQLPGRRWGYDEAVVAEFAAQMDSLRDAEGELSSERYREAWAEFRCRRLGDWYQRLGVLLQNHNPKSQLFLAAVDIHRQGELAHSLAPSLHWPANPIAALRDMGWDPATWGSGAVVPLRGFGVAPNESLAASRGDLALRQTASVQEYWNKAAFPAELIVYRADWVTPAQGTTTADEPEQLELMSHWRQWLPYGQIARQRQATSLALRDSRLMADGGPLLPNTSESSLAAWSQTYIHLPAVEFETLQMSQAPGVRNPVVVRQRLFEGRWYGYVVNASPWPVQVTLSWRGVPAQPIERLLGANLPAIQQQDRVTTIIELEPFGLVGLTSGDAEAQLVDYEFTFPEAAFEQVRRFLHQLQNRLFAVGPADPLPTLQSDVFSQLQNLSPAWKFDPRQRGNVALDVAPTNPQGIGDTPSETLQSLRMTSGSEVVWVRSPPFAAPETGRLSVVVPLRVEDPTQQPIIRISIESNDAEASYYRFGVVGGSESNSQLGTNWKQFVVHFDDIPVQGTQLQVGFDLMSAGQVWVGDFRLYDRWLDESDTKALAQLLAGAGALVDSHQSLDQCRRILEGYWPQFLDHWVGSPPAESPPVYSASAESEAVDESESVENSLFPWRRPARRTPRVFPFR